MASSEVAIGRVMNGPDTLIDFAWSGPAAGWRRWRSRFPQASAPPRRLPDEVGVFRGGRVDRHLVAAGVQQGADIFQRADAPADRERHEHDFGRPPHHVEHDLAAFMAGGDVENHQLVGPLDFIAGGELHGIAGVAEVEEIGTLDHAALIDVEARYDALGKHIFIVS